MKRAACACWEHVGRQRNHALYRVLAAAPLPSVHGAFESTRSAHPRIRTPRLARAAHAATWQAEPPQGNNLQWMVAAAAAGAATLTMISGYAGSRAIPVKPTAPQHPVTTNTSPPATEAKAAPIDAGGAEYPIIRRADVEAHKTADTGIWVTYGEGVYDITEFVAAHPGGPQRIMLAAGGSIEPFWAMYRQHKQPQVLAILKDLRIGTLPEEERSVAESADPYANDPKRASDIRVRSEAPFNGETPVPALFSHITPTDLHFKRHHLPVPDAVPGAFELRLMGDGIGGDEGVASLSLDDIAKFPKHEVAVTLQCAGNRRSEMAAVRGVRGLEWSAGAISTAVWSGALLRDVLRAHGVQPGPEARHVEFVGLDSDMDGNRYAASIPIEKALAEDGDVLLAYEMNGAPLPRDHGAPLRVVVPGVVAARSIKWVEKIIVRPDESDCHWQQKDYKGFCPDEDWDHLDWSKAPAIQETPVTSAVLSPAPGGTVPEGATSIDVAGYAVAGGGRPVVRVDISIDGGKHWRAAELSPLTEDQQRYRRAWAWRHWNVSIPLETPAMSGSTYEIVCKAVDDSYNVQPDSFGPIYNARGVLANAWHRVAVQVAPASGTSASG